MAYVLITAARNEEGYIEKTIQSIVQQTILPERWIIVSDSSTDRTEEIITGYVDNHRYIKLIRKKEDSHRNFASKVEAIRLGFGELKEIEYDFYGNLDADIWIEPNYYERILHKFSKDERLGIAGGVLYDLCKGSLRKHGSPPNSVGGPIQMFRRECYEQIGGFIPLELGNEDGVAEVMARMHGWSVRSFPELKVLHRRETGTAEGNIFSVRYREGRLEYLIGYHPIFHIARSVQRAFCRPFVVGSLLAAFGYFMMYLKRPKRPVPDEYVRYLRWEERIKLKTLLSSQFRAFSS